MKKVYDDLPNLLIAGFPKCATTTLSKILSSHSSIYIGTRKEPHFFSKDSRFFEGVNEYSKFYSGHSKEKYILDGSQTNLQLHYTAKRIKETLGDGVKTIIAVRHPIDRLVSQYNHAKYIDNIEHRRLKDLVPKEINNYKTLSQLLEYEREEVFSLLNKGALKSPNSTWGENGFPFLYFNDSAYSIHIKNYLRHYNVEDILFLTFEEISSGGQNLTSKLSEFLDIDVDRYSLDMDHSNNTLKYRVDVLEKMSPIKNVLRKVLPSQILNALKSMQNKLLMEKPKDFIPAEHYEALFSLYDNDIDETEKITSLNLSKWRRLD